MYKFENLARENYMTTFAHQFSNFVTFFAGLKYISPSF